MGHATQRRDADREKANFEQPWFPVYILFEKSARGKWLPIAPLGGSDIPTNRNRRVLAAPTEQTRTLEGASSTAIGAVSRRRPARDINTIGDSRNNTQANERDEERSNKVSLPNRKA